MVKTLEKLAVGLPTDKGTLHSYLPIYDQLFSTFRKNAKLRLLEIGVQKGGSLMLWRKYFHPRSSITGIDVADKTRGRLPKDVDLAVADAYSLEIADLFDEFELDIIIDDGPHTEASQLSAIELYAHKLSKKGVMVIEDIPSDDRLELLLDFIPYRFTAEPIDLRSVKNRFDDLMLVITRED